MNKITVQTTVKAPLKKVWEFWTSPEHIPGWAFASDDWEAASAENDLRVGGKFKNHLQAKDGSTGFDFEGIYTAVKENELLEFDMTDGRHVAVEFKEMPDGVTVTEAFDPKSESPEEVQRSGWQAFLDNFKKYVERKEQ